MTQVDAPRTSLVTDLVQCTDLAIEPAVLSAGVPYGVTTNLLCCTHTCLAYLPGSVMLENKIRVDIATHS